MHFLPQLLPDHRVRDVPFVYAAAIVAGENHLFLGNQHPAHGIALDDGDRIQFALGVLL